MKFAKLLVLSALWLTASSAVAAIADNVRQKPAITATQGFEASESIDTYYYLYNVGAQAFFTQGNAWGTQASIGSTGIKVAFTLDGSAYLFNDYPPTKGNWMLCFFDTETAMYVDRGSQANYHWGVEQGNGTFRLYAASDADGNPGWADTTDETTGEVTAHPAYREGQYMGLDASTGGTALSPYLTEADNHYIDWAFVTEAVYNDYAALVEVYEAAESLKAVLLDAAAINANVAAEEAIYNDAASTLEQLNAAITSAKAAIEKRKAEMVDEQYDNATVANPVVVTDKFIVNPDFKGDNLTTGWSGDAFGSYGPKENAEHYNKNYNTYQQITGLKAGVYAVGVKAFYRAGNAQPAYDNWKANNAASKYAKLYGTVGDVTRESAIVSPCTALQTANPNVGSNSEVQGTDDEGNTVSYWIPNNMESAEYFMHTLGAYDNKVIVAIAEGDTLTIGVKKSQGTDGDWSIFDDFSLTYYGNAADAFQMYLDEVLKNYGEVTIDEGVLYTPAYLTAYQEALQGEHKASSKEEVDAILDAIGTSYDALEKNMNLWKQWQAEVVKAGEYVANPDYEGDQLAEYVGVLGDYYDMEQEEILAAMALTNEELQAEIDKIEAAITALLDAFKSQVKDGDDVTRFIKNPGFDEDEDINSGEAEGWTIESGTGGNITRGPLGPDNKNLMEGALGYMNYCFEAWHRYNWDVWQEIEDLPKGMYELSVQGYVRCEVNGYQRGDDLTEFPSPVYLYMNSATAQFPSVYSQCPADLGYEMKEVENWYKETINDKDYPNSMGGAAQCFGWDMYKMTAYGLIAKKGDKFRIGVKMNGTQDWWCIWDNFKLTYRTPTPDIVKPALDDALKTIDTSNAMGSEVYVLAEKVINDANAAVAANDGDQMFDALSAIYDATDSIRASVSKFKELTDANGSLGAALDRAAVASIRTEGEALYGKIQNGIDNHEFETSQVDDLLGEIAVMINRLGTPADMDQASDVNPIECTGMIINPAYVDGTDEGWTGGAALSATACDAEKFSTNYDYYQLIQGLPEGTYQVTLSAYFRAGNAADDYKAYIANPDSLNNAFLYAVGEGDTCSVAIKRLASEPVQLTADDELMSEWVWCSEENRLTVPNSMTTAGDIFQTPNEATGKNYFADNRVTVKVGADGKLTIGLKKNVKITDDWTIWTNWQLFYLGKNSALTPDSDASGISEASSDAAVKVEYFSLGGQKTNGNGLVIKKETMSDGSVKSTVILK